MPELAEVETIVRSLRKSLVKRRVLRARLRPPSLYRRGSLRVGWLAGRTIARVERVGKNAVFRFDPLGIMTVNLGMTGQLLLISSKDARAAPPKKHLHGRFFFEDGSELRYYDPRRFGYIYVAPSCDFSGELHIGPDPFQCDARHLRRKLQGRKAAIKTLLLSQRVVSGLGNIYSDETLFDARIDPRTPGSRAAAHASKILASARRILDRAIAHGGSTIRDYLRPDGSQGRAQEHHAVYGRKGQPCLRCGTPIEKIVLSGRGTHFCPVCQKCGVAVDER
jgi:formamidopyrimidine-DNA glycosylase